MSLLIMILIIVVIVTSIGAWVVKRQVKKDMEQGLGRDVRDSELTSITAWMKVPPEKRGLSSISSPPSDRELMSCHRCGAPNYHWAQACHHCSIPLSGGPPTGNPYPSQR